MEAREVARSDKGQKYLFVQLGMVRPADKHPHSYPFLAMHAVPLPQAGEDFPFVSTAIDMRRYLWPLDGSSNDAAWCEPRIYAAWATMPFPP